MGVDSPRAFQGEAAERIACVYLQRAGLTLEARNFRTRRGEIDLIMRDRETLVFVEVRARSCRALVNPAETVHRS